MTKDPVDAFIRITELEHTVEELKAKVGFYQNYVKAQQNGSVAQFLQDVRLLAEAKAQELVPIEKGTFQPDRCPHDDVIIFAAIGKAQCKKCSTNLDRTFFEDRDTDILAIAELVGVTLPVDPPPLSPGIAPKKDHLLRT